MTLEASLNTAGSSAKHKFTGGLFINGGDAAGDTITGNAANNGLSGRGGNDTILGLAGLDTIIGGAGDDSLRGGDGNDLLIGGFDKDDVDGEVGTDRVLSGQGGAIRGGTGAADVGDLVTGLAPDIIDEAFATLFAFE